MTKVTDLSFREFRLDTVMLDSVIILCGRRRSGKSYLMRELMHNFHQRGMPYGKIFSGTEKCNPFFSEFFPRLFIEDTVDDDKLKGIMKQQVRLVRAERKRKGEIDENGRYVDGRKRSNNMLLVFDDMMSEEDAWKKSKYFKKIFVEGRHSNLCFCMSLQYPMGIPPALRDNVDFVFLFKSDGNNMKKLWENYAGVIPDFAMFKAIFTKLTEGRGCMVIDKSSRSSDLRDQVFHFQAKDPGPFRFGNKQFWKTHDRYYKEDESDDENETDAAQKVRDLLSLHGSTSSKYRISIAPRA